METFITEVASEYAVVRARTIADLIKSMRLAIEDGFQPQGGIAVTADIDGALFIQAVVKIDYQNANCIK